MSLTLEQMKSEALGLPEKQRARLVHELIASLESTDESADEEWDAEIKRRVDEIQRGKAKGRPRADVVRDIRARFE